MAMLLAGTIILLVGYLCVRFGVKAMKDPHIPLSRAGGYRIFLGAALAVCGLGMSLVGLVTRMF
jgi:hypothetical protein